MIRRVEDATIVAMKMIWDFYSEADLENFDYEYKSELDPQNIEGWAKEIVAFANSEDGGAMFVGVNDDRSIKGHSAKMIDKFKRMVIDNVSRYVRPIPDFDMQSVDIDGGHQTYFLRIEVPSAPTMTKYHRGDYNDVVYIRKDGETTPASPEEIAELALKGRYRVFDREKTKIPFDENRFTVLAATIEEQSKSQLTFSRALLEGAGGVTEDGFLTNAGRVFMDGLNDREVNVHCRLWPGFDRGSDETIDDQEFIGNLLELYKNASAFIRRNSHQGFVKGESGESGKVSYPQLAIHEALVNALAHRDYTIMGSQIDVDIYKDRLEITVPGSFLQTKAAQDYSSLDEIGSKRRNQSICDIFELCGMMQRNGSGFRKIHSLYLDYSNEYSPSIHSNRDSFRITLMDLTYSESATIPNREESRGGLSELQEAVLSFCSEAPKTTAEIQSITPYRSRASFRTYVLNPLLERNLLKRIGNAQSPNVRYIAVKP